MSDFPYSVGVKRSFRARHFLIGGDWGAENRLHEHAYVWEVSLDAHKLDRHGYLLDLVDFEGAVDRIVENYRGSILNELVELDSLNPSLERFCTILGTDLVRSIRIPTRPLRVVSKLWENEGAWASWTTVVD